MEFEGTKRQKCTPGQNFFVEEKSNFGKCFWTVSGKNNETVIRVIEKFYLPHKTAQNTLQLLYCLFGAKFCLLNPLPIAMDF